MHKTIKTEMGSTVGYHQSFLELYIPSHMGLVPPLYVHNKLHEAFSVLISFTHYSHRERHPAVGQT